VRTNFLGYPISNLSKVEIIRTFENLSRKSKISFVTVMNANKMYLYDKYELCKESVDESEIIHLKMPFILG